MTFLTYALRRIEELDKALRKTNEMKQRIVMFIAAAMAAVYTQAATWKDPDICYTWTYTVSGDTAKIYNYSTAEISPNPTGTLTIPYQLNGKTVSSIMGGAFEGCSGLTSVTIGNGARNTTSGVAIGDSATRSRSWLRSTAYPLMVFKREP